jgi:hypothetical protein
VQMHERRINKPFFQSSALETAGACFPNCWRFYPSFLRLICFNPMSLISLVLIWKSLKFGTSSSSAVKISRRINSKKQRVVASTSAVALCASPKVYWKMQFR